MASVLPIVVVSRLMAVLVVIAQRRRRRTGERGADEDRGSQGGRQGGSDRGTHQSLARCHLIQMP
jgi:hypothetical protein